MGDDECIEQRRKDDSSRQDSFLDNVFDNSATDVLIDLDLLDFYAQVQFIILYTYKYHILSFRFNPAVPTRQNDGRACDILLRH